MNGIITELTNLANGCEASGDKLAANICRDAIKELERLQTRCEKQHERIEELAAICETLDRVRGKAFHALADYHINTAIEALTSIEAAKASQAREAGKAAEEE